MIFGSTVAANRVLGHRNHQRIAVATEIDVGEQAGGEQILQRLVDALRIERIAGIDLHVRPDRFRLDALIALDSNLLNRVARGNRLGQSAGSADNEGAEHHPRDQRKPLKKRHFVGPVR
jgi:hypothetical protein